MGALALRLGEDRLVRRRTVLSKLAADPRAQASTFRWYWCSVGGVGLAGSPATRALLLLWPLGECAAIKLKDALSKAALES